LWEAAFWIIAGEFCLCLVWHLSSYWVWLHDSKRQESHRLQCVLGVQSFCKWCLTQISYITTTFSTNRLHRVQTNNRSFPRLYR
jgi:hypothetical protein